LVRSVTSRIFPSSLPIFISPGKAASLAPCSLYILSATACCADLRATRLASRLVTLLTRERLVLDMTLVSALAYFVQWYWRHRLAFRNRAAPHVFVESRR